MLLVMRVLSIVPLNFKVRSNFFFLFRVERELLRRFYDDQNRTTTHTKTDAHISFFTAYAVVCTIVPGTFGVQFVCPVTYTGAENIVGGNLVEHASSE